MIYRIYKTMPDIANENAAYTVDATSQVSFIFDPANTDYQTFRKEVADGVELQDADGTVMTQAEVDAFLQTIPA